MPQMHRVCNSSVERPWGNGRMSENVICLQEGPATLRRIRPIAKMDTLLWNSCDHCPRRSAQIWFPDIFRGDLGRQGLNLAFKSPTFEGSLNEIASVLMDLN